MRAYHRVDPLMDERKSHYSPAQFGAFMKVQLVAGRQAEPGTFRSLQALRDALPSVYARHVDFMVGEGDVVVRDDGRAVIDGWKEWQEGDLTVGERMKRLRARKRHTVTGGVTPNDTDGNDEPLRTEPSPPAIGVGSSVSSSPPSSLRSETPSGGDRPSDLLLEIHRAWNGRSTPSRAFIDQLNRWTTRWGEEVFTLKVQEAFAADRFVDPFGAAVDVLSAMERARGKTSGKGNGAAQAGYHHDPASYDQLLTPDADDAASLFGDDGDEPSEGDTEASP